MSVKSFPIQANVWSQSRSLRGERFTYIDHLSRDAYNEGSDLMLQTMTYKEWFGYYPQEVQVDKIYLNKEKRKLLQKLGIVCHCPPLGRPKKNPDPEEEKSRHKASGERNGIETTFGTAKRSIGQTI